MRIKVKKRGSKDILQVIRGLMLRNRVKHANMMLNKLICNLLSKESMHFEDVKVEESSLRLLNMLLVSFQDFDGDSGSTCLYPNIHGSVKVLKTSNRKYTLGHALVHVHVCNTPYNMPMSLPIFSIAYFWEFEHGHQHDRVACSNPN